MMSDVEMPLRRCGSSSASACRPGRAGRRASQDGSRKVTHITEVVEFSQAEGRYVLRDLYTRPMTHGRDGAAAGELVPTGVLPSWRERILDHGLDLPVTMLEAHREAKRADEDRDA